MHKERKKEDTLIIQNFPKRFLLLTSSIKSHNSLSNVVIADNYVTFKFTPRNLIRYQTFKIHHFSTIMPGPAKGNIHMSYGSLHTGNQFLKSVKSVLRQQSKHHHHEH